MDLIGDWFVSIEILLNDVATVSKFVLSECPGVTIFAWDGQFKVEKNVPIKVQTLT